MEIRQRQNELPRLGAQHDETVVHIESHGLVILGIHHYSVDDDFRSCRALAKTRRFACSGGLAHKAGERNQPRACYPDTPDMDTKARDLMAPDTEPTDEELALVMREARDLAVQRRSTADAWVAARLKEASAFARANTQARRADKQR